MVIRFSCLKKVKEKYCEFGHKGACCCNCIYQLKLMCYPWNKDFGKGSITEQCGWICKVSYEDNSNARETTFSDKEHGMYEYHTSRDREELKNVKLRINKNEYE